MELNKTYNIATCTATNKNDKKFERRFSKRKVVKPVKKSTTTTEYYGKNDLSIDLANAMLILSPSHHHQSVSSSNETTCIQRRRCCAVTNININKNSATEIVPQQHQPLIELPTIQEPFSDDDGFYSDTQPKCVNNNDNETGKK